MEEKVKSMRVCEDGFRSELAQLLPLMSVWLGIHIKTTEILERILCISKTRRH